ncbi:hypothetical protein MKW92_031110 [Papaver armeniacum]|nr:hypothetical protein MKW92_031110 [Papaver armeniacum]
MNEENPPTTTTTTSKKKKKESGLITDNNNLNGNIINPLLGKGKFKFWVLAAIVLLAFCSIFTGTITLKWSSSSGGILNNFSQDDDFINSPILDDLDVLEIEEREKVVKHMWDAYTHTSSRIVLPKFWRRAFEAGYQDLINDDLGVRNAAISEIAKMSIRSFINLDPPDPIQPKNGGTDKMNVDKGEGGRKTKMVD